MAQYSLQNTEESIIYKLDKTKFVQTVSDISPGFFNTRCSSQLLALTMKLLITIASFVYFTKDSALNIAEAMPGHEKEVQISASIPCVEIHSGLYNGQ